ncbi:MAG: ATP-binding protein [Thermodesulfobacteriota bacterium]|nr:ATP-binding protein [Thermodesulfobacteriota bacterium]
MRIAVASGKGGTGKTTVATNLAASLSGAVQLLDCDVEEPNAHIFLKPENEDVQPAHTMVPAVDLEKCTCCGACDEICRFSAIAQFGKAILTFPEMCHSCEGCVMVCPADAITASTRQLGEIVRGTAGHIDLIYGRLRVGEAMSPPLIDRVLELVDPGAISIIDAPPGTSCPVIAAVRDADFVLLVTEPTPFGHNDLVLAVEAVRMLELPFGIVVNRHDAASPIIHDYAEKEGIPVMMEIPDKREIAENYARGAMMVDALPEMKEQFQALFNGIQKRINE